MWQGQIEALSKHHTLVLWDMRGHGQSDYPEDPKAYSEALTVGDMAALLDEIGANRAIVAAGFRSAATCRLPFIAPIQSGCPRSSSSTPALL